jgi:hypothetical protein
MASLDLTGMPDCAAFVTIKKRGRSSVAWSFERKQWPFFIVVDDAGFPYVNPRSESSNITIDFYANILSIAKEYQIRIPLCFTLKYLDLHGVVQGSSPLPYARELISLLEENAKFVECGYHGLTHEYDEKPIEFFDIYTNSPVPYENQRSHILSSFQIIESINLALPEIFVPPGHAWQPGVTDKLLSQYGVKYIISTPTLWFNQRLYRWETSPFLRFLPRTSMGISHDDLDLDRGIRKTTRLGSVVVNGEWVKKTICPRSLYCNLRYERRLLSTPVHSYMTHIGNFSSEAMGFWRQIFDSVLERDDMHLCRTNAEAESYYRALIGDPSSPPR